MRVTAASCSSRSRQCIVSHPWELTFFAQCVVAPFIDWLTATTHECIVFVRTGPCFEVTVYRKMQCAIVFWWDLDLRVCKNWMTINCRLIRGKFNLREDQSYTRNDSTRGPLSYIKIRSTCCRSHTCTTSIDRSLLQRINVPKIQHGSSYHPMSSFTYC